MKEGMGKGVRMTPKLALMLGWIRLFISVNQFPPSIREIGDALGIASTNGVRGHIDRLVKLGTITRNPKQARSIVLVPGNWPDSPNLQSISSKEQAQPLFLPAIPNSENSFSNQR